jgi:hypothetical protein
MPNNVVHRVRAVNVVLYMLSNMKRPVQLSTRIWRPHIKADVQRVFSAGTDTLLRYDSSATCSTRIEHAILLYDVESCCVQTLDAHRYLEMYL